MRISLLSLLVCTVFFAGLIYLNCMPRDIGSGGWVLKQGWPIWHTTQVSWNSRSDALSSPKKVVWPYLFIDLGICFALSLCIAFIFEKRVMARRMQPPFD